jgi:hypothetical protein
LANPNLDPADLAAIAAAFPALAPQIAAHPQLYPDLRNWLASLNRPDVNAVLAAHAAATPGPAPSQPAAAQPRQRRGWRGLSKQAKTGILIAGGAIAVSAAAVAVAATLTTHDPDQLAASPPTGDASTTAQSSSDASDRPEPQDRADDAFYYLTAMDPDTGLWGYMDNTGSWAIKPKFIEVEDFHTTAHLAVATDANTGLQGLIGREGNWVVPPNFTFLNGYQNGDDYPLAARDGNGSQGYIDRSGDWIFGPSENYDCQWFENGLALTLDETADLLGYVDPSGEWALEPQYTFASNFSATGFAVAGVDGSVSFPGRVGIINQGGSWVVEPRFGADLLTEFDDEGLAVVSSPETGLFGAIDETGAWAIEPQFGGMRGTGGLFDDNGLAVAYPVGEAYKREGLINRSGTWVVEPVFMYHAVQRAGHGLYSVQDLDGAHLYGLLDPTGQWLVEPRFEQRIAFSGSYLAPVTDAASGLSGYIDTDGQWGIEPEFGNTESFRGNGTAIVQSADSGLWGIINESGDWVLEPVAYRPEASD